MAVAEVGDGQRLLEVGVGPPAAARLPPQPQVAHAREVGHERRRLDERTEATQLVGAGGDPLAEQAASRPHVGRISPSSMRRHVVLPAPFGPSRPHTWPRSTAKVRSSTASTPAPKRFDRPMISTTGSVIGRRSVPTERGGSTAASVAWHPMATTAGRRPRDAQRRRVYLAETPLPSSPLPGLDACARFADRVVGTLWWHERFPERDLGDVPRLRPGQRRAAGVLPRGGDRAHDHPPPPLPHQGRRVARARRTGRSASTRASRTTAAPSPACCSTRWVSSAVPTTPRCSSASYQEHGVHVAPSAATRSRRPSPLRLGRAAARRTRARPGS